LNKFLAITCCHTPSKKVSGFGVGFDVSRKNQVSYVAGLQQLCPYFASSREKMSEFPPLTFVQVSLVCGILPPLY